MIFTAVSPGSLSAFAAESSDVEGTFEEIGPAPLFATVSNAVAGNGKTKAEATPSDAARREAIYDEDGFLLDGEIQNDSFLEDGIIDAGTASVSDALRMAAVPSEDGITETIYWGISADGELRISSEPVEGTVTGGSFPGDYTQGPPWRDVRDTVYSVVVGSETDRVAPVSTFFKQKEVHKAA